jgi:molybdate transport system substrate-binding protein
MATIKVMSAGAVKAMVELLGPEFERETGNKLDLNFGTAGALRDRVKNGETSDVVILSQSIIAGLGSLVTDVTDLGRTVTGVVVKEGAPLPDISTPEAFKQALLKARAVAYTDPKSGGSGGTVFVGLLDKLGVADEVAKKAVLCKGGWDVCRAIVAGEADIATTFISEVLPVKGAKVVGPLPGHLHNANTYTGAIHAQAAQPDAAKTLLRFLTDPAKRERWTTAGLEPAF